MSGSQAWLPPPSKAQRIHPPQRGDLDRRPLNERLGPFLAWQAEWARRRAAAAAADAEMPEDSGVTAFMPDAPASTGSPTPIGATSLIAAVPSVPTPAADPAVAQTPPTDFAPRPPMDAVSLAPPGEELRRQVATLLGSGEESRRRAITFAHEVMALVPSQFGGEVSEAGAVVSRPGGEVGRLALGMNGLPPATFSVPLGWMRAPVTATYRPRCFCCDSTFGNGESHRCAALQLLATLEDDLMEQDTIILLEISQGNLDMEALRRAARKTIYRKYVSAAYGYLGKGCRVQIPDCAVSSIRCQFRAPGCDCAPRYCVVLHARLRGLS